MQAAKALRAAPLQRQGPQQRDARTSTRTRPRSAPGGGRKRNKSGFDYVFDMVEDETRASVPTLNTGAVATMAATSGTDEAAGRCEYRPPAQQYETILERFESVPVGPVISASRNGWRQYFMSKRRPHASARGPQTAVLTGTQQVRGPGPGSTEEARQRWDRLEDLWEECKIPEADRMKFSLLNAGDEIAVARHVKLLLEHRAATIHVLRCIRAREASVEKLHTLLEAGSLDSCNEDQNMALRSDTSSEEFLNSLVEARDASLEVAMAIESWRNHLTGTKPFMWERENYLLKMGSDLDVLGRGGTTEGAGAMLNRLGMSSADLLLLHFPGGASKMASQYQAMLASDDTQAHRYWETLRTSVTSSYSKQDMKKALMKAAIMVQAEAKYVLNEKHGLNSQGPLLQWDTTSTTPIPTSVPSQAIKNRPKSAGNLRSKKKGAYKKERKGVVV